MINNAYTTAICPFSTAHEKTNLSSQLHIQQALRVHNSFTLDHSKVRLFSSSNMESAYKNVHKLMNYNPKLKQTLTSLVSLYLQGCSVSGVCSVSDVSSQYNVMSLVQSWVASYISLVSGVYSVMVSMYLQLQCWSLQCIVSLVSSVFLVSLVPLVGSGGVSDVSCTVSAVCLVCLASLVTLVVPVSLVYYDYGQVQVKARLYAQSMQSYRGKS